MITRRDFLQVSAATAAMLGGDSLAAAANRQTITQDKMLEFDSVG